MKEKRIILLAGIACAVLLVLGLTRLFLLRFNAGDVYPMYSSLRADPLGTRALYESLGRCEEVSVSRSFQPFQRLRPSPDTTVLYLGDTIYPQEHAPGDVTGLINSFLRRGGRMVIAVLPRNRKPLEEAVDEEDENANGEPDAELVDDEGGDTGNGEGADDEEDLDDIEQEIRKRVEDLMDDESEGLIDVRDWLLIDFSDEPLDGPAEATLASDLVESGLPQSLSCYTSLFFKEWIPEPDEAGTNMPPSVNPWRTIYEREGKPVVVERQIGRGTIVLSALSYFASNEAMRKERHPALLVWLLGEHRRIVFDEYHHGLSKDMGVAGLVRRYRMHGVAAVFVVLAALFVWRSASCLVPRSTAEESSAEPALAEGKGSTAGLVNLLRCNIPGSALLRTCLHEWERALPHGDSQSRDHLPGMRAELQKEMQRPVHRRELAQAYNRMARMANRRTPDTESDG